MSFALFCRGAGAKKEILILKGFVNSRVLGKKQAVNPVFPCFKGRSTPIDVISKSQVIITFKS